MNKWIVITEVESEVDPAVFKYVNGTTLISSTKKEVRTWEEKLSNPMEEDDEMESVS